LIYGYLRVASESQDEDLRRTELELRRFAEVEGFCLATIFHEYTDGSHDAFNELTEQLKRADVHLVVVPTLAHLSSHPLLRASMLTLLDLRAHAHVLAVDEQ